MLSIATALLGFASPFLPELLKFFTRRQDNAHELALMELRLKAGAQEHLWKMEEITAEADIAEARALHRPQPSFGVQILDKAHDSGMSPWLVAPVFYLFAALDVLSGLVRPAAAYASFALYAAYKWALYETLVSDRFGNTTAGALTQLWGEQDWNVLVLILSYWFGARTAKLAFGGRAR
jgi:hypothetical protein